MSSIGQRAVSVEVCERAPRSVMPSPQRSSCDATVRPPVAYGTNEASKPNLPPSTQTKDPSGTPTACNSPHTATSEAVRRQQV